MKTGNGEIDVRPSTTIRLVKSNSLPSYIWPGESNPHSDPIITVDSFHLEAALRFGCSESMLQKDMTVAGLDLAEFKQRILSEVLPVASWRWQRTSNIFEQDKDNKPVLDENKEPKILERNVDTYGYTSMWRWSDLAIFVISELEKQQQEREKQKQELLKYLPKAPE